MLLVTLLVITLPDVFVARSSREISHKNADERPTKRRWSWEKLFDGEADDDNSARSVLS